MSNESKKTTLLTSLIGVLIATVVALAWMVLQTNSKLDVLAATTGGDVSVKVDKDDGTSKVAPLVPFKDQNASPNPFSSPFDPDNWDPFREMDDMHRRIDAMFNDAFGRFGKMPGPGGKMPGPGGMLPENGFTPRMDLMDEGDHFVVRLDVPGAKESEINVSLKDDMLSVEASSKMEKEQTGDDKSIRRERRMGHYRRQIALPAPVDADSMKTTYEDGVLSITVDKAKKEASS